VLCTHTRERCKSGQTDRDAEIKKEKDKKKKKEKKKRKRRRSINEPLSLRDSAKWYWINLAYILHLSKTAAFAL